MLVSQAKLPNWRLVALVLAIFGVAYGSLALVNHYLFRSYAYDLGIYNQALWDYAHLRLNANSILRYNNILGDHFTPGQMLWAPLYYLFGSYTLVAVQIGLVLGGGYGAYQLHLLRTRGEQAGAALGLLVMFLSTWGIYSALAYDYHDNVLAAMLLPWLIYWFEADRRGRAAVVAGLMAASKENMALWLVFIALGLAVLHWRTPARRRWALGLAAAAGLYAVVVLKFVVPALSQHHGFYHQKYYTEIGGSVGGALHLLLTRPGYLLKLFFVNQLADANGDYVKAELYIMLLLSGGLALLRRPAYLLMLAPIFAQKLLSNNVAHWGINAQYSVEFVPVLHAALSHWLAQTAPRRAAWWAGGAATLALAATIASMQLRKSPAFDKPAAQFFRRPHYRRDFDAGRVHRGLARVPAEARVSATSALVPHLAARPYIYQFPDVYDADYIVTLAQASTYPLSEAQLAKQLAAYQASGEWVAVLQDGPLTILRRRQPQPWPARRFYTAPAEIPQ